MKITATGFNGKDVRVSIEYESEAEKYQLKELRKKLIDEGAHCLDWDNTDGSHGICIVVEKMPKNCEGGV